ncbi:hypothetical protein GALMADRAFT_138626 [Galerina marginata CBS 339.88]|uniref:Uncharacterized protein n=1 Tax=Galerina marginata (strain CBS 339.88) TaxID=685588 RepID=A0A067T339_GALM3|nr:hypothetical protein GALMADRAFT_138626 [Galerina marginata CBS 339.88]
MQISRAFFALLPFLTITMAAPANVAEAGLVKRAEDVKPASVSIGFGYGGGGHTSTVTVTKPAAATAA